MKKALDETVAVLKEKYPESCEFIEEGRQKYAQEVEREGFFVDERLKGDFSQPLKQNEEIDLDSLFRFFESQSEIEEEDEELVQVIVESVIEAKQKKYGLYNYESILALNCAYKIQRRRGNQEQAHRLKNYLLNILKTATEKRNQALRD